MSDKPYLIGSKPGSSCSTGTTPKAGSGATDPKPVPATGSSASAPPASSSGPKPVAPTPGSSTSAPPVGGSSGSKPVPSTPGSSSSSPANSPNPSAALSGSSCSKPPGTTSAPAGSSSSCPSGTGSGPTASANTPPPPPASSKGCNDIDLVGPTGLSSSAPPARASSQSTSPIPSLDLAPTSSPMPNATFPPRFVPALGSGRPSYARSRSMFQSAPSRSGSAVRPPLYYQQMLSPPPTPNMGSSGRRPVGPYAQMGPQITFSPSPMEDPYGAGGGSQSGESRGPRQIPVGPPGFQDNYGSYSRDSRGLRQTAHLPTLFRSSRFSNNYGPGGGSQSGESRGPRQPFAGAGSFGGPESGGARPNTALGPFAFLSGPINWQNHPLAVNFASLLRSYLNRNGYRDGVSDPNYGARQSYGSTGRWNSAGSRGVSSGYPQAAPQGGTPRPYPPPDY